MNALHGFGRSNRRPRNPFARELRMLMGHPDLDVKLSIPIARSPHVDRDYMIPLDLLADHVLVVEPSGGGVATQVINNLAYAAALHGINVVSLSFGANPMACENSRLAAEDAGHEFLRFSNELGTSSHCFNPVQVLADSASDSMFSAEMYVAATGGTHGDGARRNHYRFCQTLAAAVLLRPNILPPGKQTFREFARLLLEPRNFALPAPLETALKESVTESLATALTLAGPNNINSQIGIDPGRHIDLDRACRPGSKLQAFFEIPLSPRPAISVVIGQTVATKFIHALSKLPNADGLRLLLVIHDAEPIIGAPFKQLLHMATSKGCGIVLLIRGRHEAATSTDDYWKMLETGTATKIYMGADDPAIVESISRTANGIGLSEIMLATARGYMAFIRVRKDVNPWYQHGHTIPVVLTHIEKTEDTARRTIEPPELPGSVVVTMTDVFSDLMKQYGHRDSPVVRAWKEKNETTGPTTGHGQPQKRK